MLFIFRDQIPPKKNSRQLIKKKNALISIPSDKYLKWSKYIKDNIENVYYGEIDKLKQYGNKTNLLLKIVFFPHDGKLFDLTNVLQSIEDTFTDLGVIEDDNYEILRSFSYTIDKDNKNNNVFAIVELVENTKKNIGEGYDNIYNLYENNMTDILKINRFEYTPPKKKKSKSSKNKKPKVFFEPDV